MSHPHRRPATALLALADGTLFRGQGLGPRGISAGEVVFNTAITGYQEILTDPSYAGQIITFTFPHIGNVGANLEDVEAATPFARGLVLRAEVTEPSNWRSAQHLGRWLEDHGLRAIAGLDSRRLTRHLRSQGSQNGALAVDPDGIDDAGPVLEMARAFPGIQGMDLAKEVTSRQRYGWDETVWRHGVGHGRGAAGGPHVVVVDYGIKRNILRSLASFDCRLTVVPATTTADDMLALAPDGLFLSNGPGDPAATGEYAVPEIKKLLARDVPLFGICLGHQLLALSLGAATEKMPFGHHGANHPVKDEESGKVEITSQNHGFTVLPGSLPPGVKVTHRSLFDGTVEGLRVEGRPVFSVQYHPEASPGPQDSAYLFERFLKLIRRG